MLREIETLDCLNIAQSVADIEGGATKKFGDSHSLPSFLLHLLQSENARLRSYENTVRANMNDFACFASGEQFGTFSN